MTSPETQNASEALRRSGNDLGVCLADLCGLPRSVGEILGCTFFAERAICSDDVVARLRISRGSASQGLALLKQIGAIRGEYLPGDRREYFVSENNLSRVIAGFLQQRLLPGLSGFVGRLESLERQAGEEGNAHFKERIAKLRQWKDKADARFPRLLELLSE